MYIFRSLARDSALHKLLWVCFSIKLLHVLLIIVVYYSFGIWELARSSNFLAQPDELRSLLSAFTTWDAQHYIFLAQHWYAPAQQSNAFYPLFPLLIRMITFIFPHVALNGIVLANLFSCVAVVLFYFFVRKIYGEKTAFRATVLLMTFPMTYYFSLPYVESLFLTCILFTFIGIYTHRLGFIICAALLLPLAKPQGIIAAIPILYGVWVQWKGYGRPRYIALLLTFIAFLISAATYFFLMHVFAGSALAGFAAQQYFDTNYSVNNLLHPLAWLHRNIFNLHLTIYLDPNNSVSNRIFFFCFLTLVYGAARYTDKIQTFYLAFLGCFAAFTGDLASFPRYLLVLFPIYIVLAQRYEKKYWVVASTMFVLQLLYLTLHSMNFWVA
ncbi:MAG: hypothetical protein HYV32_01525 [Candidatus Kerfeldbacteria bacterium]|nr:hypothetical protein [Candidatus Kerfeldbacteria bacterium]